MSDGREAFNSRARSNSQAGGQQFLSWGAWQWGTWSGVHVAETGIQRYIGLLRSWGRENRSESPGYEHWGRIWIELSGRSAPEWMEKGQTLVWEADAASRSK